MARKVMSFQQHAKEAWRNFIKNGGVRVKVAPTSLPDYVKANRDFIQQFAGAKVPISLIISLITDSLTDADYVTLEKIAAMEGYASLKLMTELPRGVTNMFLVNSLNNFAPCLRCHSSVYVVLLMDDHDEDSLDNMVFLPGAEAYSSCGITPGSCEFAIHFPVPINKDTDLWYCPNCQQLHSFTYHPLLTEHIFKEQDAGQVFSAV